MLHEMRIARGTEGPSASQSEITGTLGINDTTHINTRSNHQLQDVSRVTEHQDQSVSPVKQTETEEHKNDEIEEEHLEEAFHEGEGESEKSEAEGEGDENNSQMSYHKDLDNSKYQ